MAPTTPVTVVGGRSADPSTPVAILLQNRFAPWEAPRASRRLVLIGGGGNQFASWIEPFQRSVEVRDEPVADVVGEVEESDMEGLPCSIAGDEEVVPHIVEDRVVDVGFPRNVVLRMALSLLGDVDTSVVFRQRAAVMRTVPHFLRSSCRNAMKLALEEATWGNHRMDAVRQERGWKFYVRQERVDPIVESQRHV